MKDIKTVVADNLTQLRKANKLTQAQLAEKFNYTDKAICRWEHGDTLPDINTLYALAEFYGVTMNDLVNPDFEIKDEERKEKTVLKYRLLISAVLLVFVWLLTLVIFITSIALGYNYWIIFVWAVPASCMLLLRLWRRQDIPGVFRVINCSVLIWTSITSVFLHLLFINGVNAWIFYLIGIPLQFLVILWKKIKEYKNNI